MALLVDAVVSTAVCVLLDQMLRALKDWKHRDNNLQKLELLLQRLQPFVTQIQGLAQDNSSPLARQEESVHLVHQWLEHLREQLEAAQDMIQECIKVKTGILAQVRNSRKFLTVYEGIWRLLSEASMAQWAVEWSNIKILRQASEDAHNDRAEMKGKLDKLEQQILIISEAFTSEPSCFRTREIKRTVSKQSFAVDMQNDALSSSALSSLALSFPSFPKEKQYWNRDSDIAEPTVSFGGDKVAQRVISNLVNPERYRKWVGLWAIGGAGKTFTARKIFNNDRICQHFSGGRYWVTVSKDQPPIDVLLRELYECIGGEGKFPGSLEDARAVLKTRLNRDKVLLILDDVWEAGTLQHLDLISDGTGGVVLITTRDANILRSSVGSDDIIQIQRLSEDDSWKLFSYHAFHVHNKDVPSDLEDVARAVADECGGLPLALQVIGSTMAGKDIRLFDWEVQQLGISLRQEWEYSLDKLRRANVVDDEYERLYRRLQLSVDNLDEEDSRLQDCFFSFAAFPEDYPVDVDLLVTIWVADGIVGNREEDVAHQVREGKGLLALLISKSMIQLIPEVDRGNAGNSCRIHDVMRDLAHRNLKSKVNQQHGSVQIPPSQRTCLYAPGLKLTKFPEQWTTSSMPYFAKRLSLHSNALEQLPDRFNGQHLRVLILSGNPVRTLPPGFFMSMSQLTVLYLSRTGVREISDAILRSLKSLVLLNLAHCHELRRISNRIDSLQNLQFITLDGCGRIGKLPRMRSLTNLHTISLLGRERRNRSFIGPPSDIRQVLQIRNLKQLHVGLSFRTAPDISPLSSLEELTMVEVQSFPQGMTELRNLRILHVFYFRGKSIPALENLPSLEDVEIYAIKVEHPPTFPESFGHSDAFPSLKSMRIVDFTMNETFAFHQGAMPKIQRLKLDFPSHEQGHLPPSLMVLGSNLNFLRLVWPEDGKLELVFREPSRFPHLEYLQLGKVDRLPSTIASLPKLKGLWCDVPRREWPQNLVQLEEQGKVKIEIDKNIHAR